MAKKKSVKKIIKKTKKVTAKIKVAKTKDKQVILKIKPTKSKAKKSKIEQSDDMGIVIVDDNIEIDQEKVNEERRAYLEESRSQDAYD
ncbi:MAG: hypothetical protein CK527_04010 [Nitrosarchaeum sp.]|nr:hypothetical protein [Nitrosarchaeum sp.]PHY09092.1 MAG: hypothetical protein CK527_04010 [Nitrosarchaeum sp.]